MTLINSEAAAARATGTANRLAQLKDRLERLQRGDPTTADDAQSARHLAFLQTEALAVARERLMLTHRSAIARQKQYLDRHPNTGPRHIEADRATVGAAPSAPPVPAVLPHTANEESVRRSDRDEEVGRLRAALATMLTESESESGSGDVDGEGMARRTWSEAIVAQCGSPAWRSWGHSACTVAVDAFSSARSAAISIVGPDGIELVGASDAWSSRLQELELLVGEGPSITAHANNRLVHVDDFAGERQAWQGYASATSEHDVHSITAIPLHVHGLPAGVLTIYGLASSEARAAAAFADVAASALLIHWHQSGPGEVGDPAWFSFYLAIGVTASRLDVSVHEAEARLRAHAFGCGITLAEVAALALSDQLDLA